MTNEQAWLTAVFCFGAVILGAMGGAYLGILAYFTGEGIAPSRTPKPKAEDEARWHVEEWGMDRRG